MPNAIRTSGQLGPVLKQLRKQRNLSQAELGSRIGLSQERISAIENHPEKVTFDTLLTVLMALQAQFIVADSEHSAQAATALKGTPREEW